jgi:hypothetical protein
MTQAVSSPQRAATTPAQRSVLALASVASFLVVLVHGPTRPEQLAGGGTEYYGELIAADRRGDDAVCPTSRA